MFLWYIGLLIGSLRDEAMMTNARTVGRRGPAIRALDPWVSSTGKMRQLLSEEERARLAVIASIVRFKKGAEIYREGHRADAIFNIISGVVKAYRKSRDRSEHITAFLFPDDLLGLSEEGRYTNSARAITPVTAFQIPVSALRSRLSKDASLEFHVICKLCQELRQAQRHAFLLARRQADSKVAMFLQLFEQLQAARGESTTEIYLPMSRSDIGEYVGMSIEAVSRAFRSLAARGIIKTRNRRHVEIVNRTSFENVADDVSYHGLHGRPVHD
ncbi:MAG: Crp/Fnr family transcriptional regulator [Xanthobacteraceae bacterium]